MQISTEGLSVGCLIGIDIDPRNYALKILVDDKTFELPVLDTTSGWTQAILVK